MTAGHFILTMTLSALAAGCDSRAIPTAPAAPSSTPAPLAPNPLPGPEWSGTFMTNSWPLYSPFPILARLERTGNTVKGNWYEVVWLDFGGTIEGTIDDTVFVGTVTILGCQAQVQGTFTDTSASLKSPAVSDGCSAYGLPSPVDITFQLSRAAR